MGEVHVIKEIIKVDKEIDDGFSVIEPFEVLYFGLGVMVVVHDLDD